MTKRSHHRDLDKLLKRPVETLDTEIKCWLDLKDNAHRATMAKSIIALANNDGGRLLIGFHEKGNEFVPDTNRPGSLNDYLQDAIQAIVEKYIDPPIQTQVEHVEHEDNKCYPVILVPGGHTVPVRSKKGGPDNDELVANTYYIRRPGPKSEPPADAHEWDVLIQRCILNSRDELLTRIEALLSSPRQIEHEESAAIENRFMRWVGAAENRMLEKFPLSNLDSNDGAGYWCLGYARSGGPLSIDRKQYFEVLRRNQLKVTGWPQWIFLNRGDLAPHLFEDEIECVVLDRGSEHKTISAHSDYWRASLDPFLILFRGYFEDEVEECNPRTCFDFPMAIWRVSEALLHASYLAEALDRTDSDIIFYSAWKGLAERKFASIWSHRSMPIERLAHQNVVSTLDHFPAGAVRAKLASMSKHVLDPVFELFDFVEIEEGVFEAEIEKMRAR